MGNPSSVDQIAKIKSILYLSLLQLIPTKVYLLWGSNLNFRAKNEVCDFSTFLGFLSNKNFLFSFACITKEKKCITKYFLFFCRKEFCLVIIRLIVKCKTFKKGPLTRVYPELCDLLDNVAEVLQRQFIQDPTILDKEVYTLLQTFIFCPNLLILALFYLVSFWGLE